MVKIHRKWTIFSTNMIIIRKRKIGQIYISNLSDFHFSSYGENSSKMDNDEYKNDHVSKNKNLKIDFSFVSVHFASFM